MTDRRIAVPKMGADGAPLRVPFPGRDPMRRPLALEGEIVDVTPYWLRRARHGDVEFRAESPPEPAAVAEAAAVDASTENPAEAVTTDEDAPVAEPEESPRTRRKADR